jgi:DNA primase
LDRTGKADNNPSWYINIETGAHICFSCGFKGGLYYLVCYLKGFFGQEGANFDQARKWLGDLDEGMSEALEKAETKKLGFEDLSYISEATLSAFDAPPVEALCSRGLTQEAAKDYCILWDTRQENWIIPIRDPYTGALMGWQEKGYKSRYFKNYPTGMKKSLSIFGYGLYEGGDMIVVESPLDAVRLRSVGIQGGVALYGALPSKEQVNIIKGADRIIFALDNDEAGKSSAYNLAKMGFSSNFDSWFFNYDYTDQKDIGGMSKPEIITGLDTARHVLRHLRHLR